ncbi:preprotein translocase subunit SecG [Phenylobacterium sp.]|jgi:preprotein translocase subunit SecG|uniref:preprotein translocase subunit SecG n=1 Tax=Phenylobacterium sp. TaxID=1871053 RepID=UPI002E3293A0|nr:preprotein translocase subunit SecG [Phenylobacterium sp.]HEX2561230.1 preprotein translocase subunit SecG [Phenylobacterium sp.]
MLLGILLTVHILVCVALIGVVLLQRSEGGGLVSGGGSNFMSARGGSDLLTRTTWILGTIFFVLSLALTMLSGGARQGGSITDRFEVESVDPDALNRQPEAPAPTAPLIPGAPATAPAPTGAPTPTLRNPLELPPAQPAPAPAAPAQ